MKIATFNANSIRARLDIVLEWLYEHEPDLLAIQETKVEDGSFPREAFEDAGWLVEIHGQKSYNGVAFVSREPVSQVARGFGDPTMPEDCRILAGTFRGVRVLNTYVPNGNTVGSEKFAYKLQWLTKFRDYLLANGVPGQPVLWLGDINIAPKPDDVFESPKHLGKVGHHKDEFAALAALTDLGLTDLFRKFTEGPGHYTFWEFVIRDAVKKNLGWRIDHIYATPSLAERCTGCTIDVAPRLLERPSDHTFVIAEFQD